jgi:hypothetical protein
MLRINEYNGESEWIAREEEVERSERAREAAARRIRADFVRAMDSIDGTFGAAVIGSLDEQMRVAAVNDWLDEQMGKVA